jgi:preprotein translocase subunit SecE
VVNGVWKMNKAQEAVTAVKMFVEDVRNELKKCSWPTRAELLESTVVVIVSVLIVGVFVGASDMVLLAFLKLVVH